jgi:hypothetical protein
MVFMVNNFIIPVAGMVTGIILGSKLIGTIRHYIDRRLPPRAEGDLTREVAELRSRLDEMERATDRVEELEDRLEFAERLLTRARGPEQAEQQRG